MPHSKRREPRHCRQSLIDSRKSKKTAGTQARRQKPRPRGGEDRGGRNQTVPSSDHKSAHAAACGLANSPAVALGAFRKGSEIAADDNAAPKQIPGGIALELFRLIAQLRSRLGTLWKPARSRRPRLFTHDAPRYHSTTLSLTFTDLPLQKNVVADRARLDPAPDVQFANVPCRCLEPPRGLVM